MPDSFGIQEETRGSAVLLRVRGRLDARSAPHLLEVGSRVRMRGRNLVLDLSGVTFMASSGLGSLLSLAEEFRQTDFRLRIASPSAAVTSVIQLLNLQPFLSIDASEEEALHALGV
ncbi:MAG TPA: anti-sigma factor antagonist [Candidatus Eisenbacteria bacterium]|jgi:anti-sigma B factor antagonist|nr:anti-sigma factor antagonist [Candidatus Eisenbacteria bacterium]